MTCSENKPTKAEIDSLIDRILESRASQAEIQTSLDYIEQYEDPAEEINGLINAITASVEHPLLVPRLISALKKVRSPDKGILLIRALRRRGHVQDIVDTLVEISNGVDWDPERQAWLVALRTLAAHTQETKDLRALRMVERAVSMDGLTDQQISWAKRCLSIAQK